MGLLDELEKEAGAARTRRTHDDAGGRERAAAVEARLAPAMADAERYFERLAAHLADIDRVIEARYEIPDVGTVECLQQSGYAMRRDELATERGFRFVFRCVGRVPVQARFNAEAVAAGVERALRDARLGVRRVDEGGPIIVLRVEPDVPVSIALSADVEHGNVVMTTLNLFGIGEQTHRFDPARIDSELLDAVGHCVLRKPSRFAELTGNALGAEQRRRLARDAARRQRRREAELGGSMRRGWYLVSEGLRRLFRGQ